MSPHPHPRLDLRVAVTFDLGEPIRQCYVMPLRLGSGGIDAIAVSYSNSGRVNPWIEMFCFPTDTLKLAVYDLTGRRIWRRDLGPGVVPELAFCPVFPFDLNGDGVDELYFVNNIDPDHPLAISKYRLERLDARTGESIGQAPWPAYNVEDSMNDMFRNAIFGGYAHGQPVLVTTQGLYGNMYLQGWNADLTRRWEVAIPQGAPGARGSHMHPVLDINEDGVDEVLWGERCIELSGGRELFCADADTYSGHSDTIQPLLDPTTGQWLIYTTREKQNHIPPRVAVYDATGKRVWGAIDQGHMHVGWVAQLHPDRRTAIAIRIGSQVQTKESRQLFDREPFAFDAVTGEPRTLPFDPFQCLPVDLDGDGLHELVRGTAHDGGGNGEILNGEGQVLGSVGGPVALTSRILDTPGEQLLTYARDGVLRLWLDANARPSERAAARYAHPFYALNQRSSGDLSHLHVLGGI